MILPDSSAWIEFQRATGSPAHLRLRRSIASGEQLATVGMVWLEVLAGSRDDRQAHALRRLLSMCRFLAPEEPTDSETAATLYRTCRRHGRTIRRLPDCLIAAIAIRSSAAILHADADFDVLAELTGLTVVSLE